MGRVVRIEMKDKRRKTKASEPSSFSFSLSSSLTDHAVYELTLEDQVFTLEVAAGRLEVTRGGAPSGVTPAAAIHTDTATLAAVVWHGHPLAEAARDGSLRVDGDPEAAADFVGLFAPPVPAAADHRPG